MNVIEFTNVWKKFRKGEKLNSLRDMIPFLFRKALPGGSNGDLKQQEFWALKDVSFAVKKGEVVGIIGPNGAGKSTTLKLLSGIIRPNKGNMKIEGRLSALIEVTAGFHPELTGRENIYLNGTILGMKRKEIDEKFDEIVEFSGLSEFIDTPVKRYSSGMYSRLGFSVAAHMDPDVLLVDEVLSVGDIAFQAKCAQKMRELLSSGATIVLVSHNLSLVQSLCKRAILLDQGIILKEGTAEEIIPYYQNIVYQKSEEKFKKKLIFSDYKVKINQEPLVNILNVTFYDDKHNAKKAFNKEDNILIEFEYETIAQIEKPVFSLEIVRSDNVLCCTTNTKNQELLTENTKHRNTMVVNLGKINLAPGVYLAKISIWDKDMVHYYITRKNDFFRVSTIGVNNAMNAVFLPKAEWKLITK
jgi:lipopolysaccharide transport system ATP-binding protein